VTVTAGREPLGPVAIGELRERLRGPVLEPGRPGYDEARRVYNAMFAERRPAAIARCTGAADVMAAVRWAKANDALVAVKAGGHSVAGWCICEGGLVLDLSPMQGVVVDPETRRAVAQAGTTWGGFDRETQAFGLATTGGRVTSTGIAGLTLGSGSGWLERRYGLTADNLRSADVVTADGLSIKASRHENAELFWGLRGGGGNFGVVTSFEFELHPVGPLLQAGLLFYDLADAGRVMREWREFMHEAPDELTTGVSFLTLPPAPFIPDHLKGKPGLGMFVVHCGDPDKGEEATRALRRIGPPAVDLLGPTPYTVLQTLLDEVAPAGRLNYWKSDNLSRLPDEAIDVFVDRAANFSSPLAYFTLEPKGGAIGRVGEQDTALGGRDTAYAFYVVTMWTDPAESDRHIAWTRDFAKAMQPYSRAGMFLNFSMDEGQERIRQTYGDARYDRLVALKDAWDPGNLFRHNANIRPSSWSGTGKDAP
jgi:FAD/FMN-containing dehydrogenase